jgi:hypothetical protein
MKTFSVLMLASLSASLVWADGLPVISSNPQTQTVTPASTAMLSVTAAGATSYQWRFNGVDIPGATSANLSLTNAQMTNAGYYVVVAQNSFGWVPSQLAYLSVVDTPGEVPFSNYKNANAVADYEDTDYGYFPPITNGTAEVLAGPALDQMQPAIFDVPPLGPPPPATLSVKNGYFNYPGIVFANSVEAGQTVYYQVTITYPDRYFPGGTYTQPSTVLKLVAGGNGYPTPSTTNLYFPVWEEWPEPVFWPPPDSSPTNELRVPGESFSLTNLVDGFNDLGPANFQWRKDGQPIGVVTTLVGEYDYYSSYLTLSFTNFQPSDVGVYDVLALGNDWLIGPKTYLAVQLTNGPGLFQTPRLSGGQFVCDLAGAQGRNYAVQWSTNLSSWIDLLVVSNSSGTVTFTNTTAGRMATFYRTRLLP